MNIFFQYHSPEYLFLLLVLPVLFWVDWRKRFLIKLPTSSQLLFSQKIKKTWKQSFEFLPSLLKTIALGLFILALARPQWGENFSEVTTEGVDIILTIDTSGSMAALDMFLEGKRVDRLTAVKSVVHDFIEQRAFDRLGMIVFGSEAYTQCPLTTDKKVLQSYLNLLEVGISGDGTAIGNAIATSVNRLENSEAKSKIIILLTDGVSNAGQINPQIAAELAAKRGVKIYAISFGTSGTVPISRNTPFGKVIERITVSIDEKSLQEIAQKTQGKFFSAQSVDMLKSIYEEINTLEKSEIKTENFSEFNEDYLYYLIPGIFLFIVQWFLQHTVFRRIP